MHFLKLTASVGIVTKRSLQQPSMLHASTSRSTTFLKGGLSTAEYQQAMQERKGYWVDRLQGSIAADLDALHVSKLAADRTSRQHRSTSSSLKKHARATRIRLEKSIQQLQEWHAVPGDIGHVPYDPTVLSVAVMEQQNWMFPWFTCSPSQSIMHSQIVDLQRILPCSEEERIVVRQTEDAVAFHSQQLETLKAAIEAREAGSVTTDSDSFLQEDASVGMDISTAEPHTVQQYSEGQLHVLRQKEARCQRL